MPKVSIILTTHGPAPYLRQAIGSVLAQTFEDWECIVAYDGSNLTAPELRIIDERFDVWDLYVPEGVQCRFASTINQAFKYCKGDYITYLCHDDLYLPWRLDRMIRWFNGNPSWDIAFGHQMLISEGESGIIMGGLGSHNRQIREGDMNQPAGTVDHSSVMHRRECFEKSGGWDENAPMRYGDAYFWMRLQNAGYKFHCIPEVLDVHRFNRESITWKEDHPQAATV